MSAEFRDRPWFREGNVVAVHIPVDKVNPLYFCDECTHWLTTFRCYCCGGKCKRISKFHARIVCINAHTVDVSMGNDDIEEVPQRWCQPIDGVTDFFPLKRYDLS